MRRGTEKLLWSRCSALLLLLIATLQGCANSIPEEALRLHESALDIRSMQTKSYAVKSESVILSATVAALQDMEYNIDALEKSLGIISASKVTDVDSAAQKIGLILMDAVCVLGGDPCGAYGTARDRQTTSMTMVVLPSLERNDEFVVRVTLQRAVFDKQGRILTLENINDADTYQDVFEKLNKAIFLEGES